MKNILLPKTKQCLTRGAYLIILLLGFGLASCDQAEEEKTPPVNILWIVAEDLSPDIGCYGHPFVHTPNIDGLAKNGVRFTHAFSAAPVCAPSRTAMAVGMHQTAINAHHMRYPKELLNPLPDSIIPLNEQLRRANYQTANIKDKPGSGKMDWSFSSPIAHFDHNHWDSIQADKAFFAVCNLRLTHRAFDLDTIRPVDPGLIELPPYYPDNSVSRKDWAEYLESVQVLDRQVGDVLTEIEKRGWKDNTIVFFFSDHGRPMSRAKNHHYDGGWHIPLIISAPEGLDWRQYLPAGTEDTRLISSLDLTTTSLQMAGVTPPTYMHGRVILGPETDAEREHVFCANDRIGETFFKARSVRSKRYKYIRNFNHDFSVNSSATAYRKAMHPIYHVLNILNEKGELTEEQKRLVEPVAPEELYDLQDDPYEVRNLVENPAYKEVLDQMRKELADWQERYGDYGMEADSPALTEAFDAYGIKSNNTYAKKIQALEDRVRAALD